MSYNTRYLAFSPAGVPLVPYVPDPKDIALVPAPDYHYDYFQVTEEFAVSTWGTPELRSVSVCGLEHVQAAADEIKEVIIKWEETARLAGHKYPRLYFDGSDFYPAYYREATLDELMALKEHVTNASRAKLAHIEALKRRIEEEKEWMDKFGGE